MSNPTCKTCRWWGAPAPDDDYGVCYRFPPRDGDERVVAECYCGEHQPREAAPEQPDTAALTAGRDRAQAEVDKAEASIQQMGARITALEDALRPFAEAADNFDVIETQDGFVWNSTIHRERISTWMGPSDFGRARAALSGTTPRPRIDPETRRVLENAGDDLAEIARALADHGMVNAAVMLQSERIRAHLAKLDGGSND